MTHVAAVFALVAVVAAQAPAAVQSGQAEPRPSPKLEALLQTDGAVFVKEFTDMKPRNRIGNRLGPIGLEIQALVVWKVGGDPVARGVLFSTSAGYGFVRSSFVDANELDGLSKALDYAIETAAKWKQEERAQQTEVTYRSNDGFSVGFIHEGKKQKAFAAAGVVSPVHTSFGIDDLVVIKDAVIRSIELLKNR